MKIAADQRFNTGDGNLESNTYVECEKCRQADEPRGLTRRDLTLSRLNSLLKIQIFVYAHVWQLPHLGSSQVTGSLCC